MGHHDNIERVSYLTAILTYFAFAMYIVFGHAIDFVERLLGRQDKFAAKPPPGYAPLLADFDDFYKRHLYMRIRDCWNRPISSGADAEIDVMERTSKDFNRTFDFSGKSIKCLNLASYNYLGFGHNTPDHMQLVKKSLSDWSYNTASPLVELGTTKLHVELEEMVARFVGREACICFPMGFATNSTCLPCFADKETLILSDELNHSSIVTGARSSGARVKPFKHNDVEDLERVLRKSIVDGQTRVRRAWKKILIIVEGIYSMEGETCPLPQIVALKKKYKAYLYLDEAHSIGAMGKTGKGVCEHFGVDPNDVDIMMGTFTKSFGSIGGYIAGTKDVIREIRRQSAGSVYESSMSPTCCQQVIAAMQIILGEDGTDIGAKKLKQLHDNSNMFRAGLKEMGCEVLGEGVSAVVPVMLYNPCKMPAFSRMCLEVGLAVVVVGYPATPITLSRVRFCLSAAHTTEQLKEALAKIKVIAQRIGICYNAC